MGLHANLADDGTNSVACTRCSAAAGLPRMRTEVGEGVRGKARRSRSCRVCAA
jgi:hypothetical protein